jgi:hypothetical protein
MPPARWNMYCAGPGIQFIVDTVDSAGCIGVDGSPITAARAAPTSAHVRVNAGVGSTGGA